MSLRCTITAGLMLMLTCSTVMAGPVNRFHRTKQTHPACGCNTPRSNSSHSMAFPAPGIPQEQETVQRRGPVNRFHASGRTVAPAKPPAFIADLWQGIFRR